MNKRELRKWRENYTSFTGVCLYDGLKLNVHFSEKDFIKDIGGQWHPDPSGGKNGYWWMPCHLLEVEVSEEVPLCVSIFQQEDDDAMLHEAIRSGNSLSVFDWLNLNKMISGEGHGELNREKCKDAILGEEYEHYVLRATTGGFKDSNIHFKFFSSLDIVCVSVFVEGNGPDANFYKTKEEARLFWDSLVDTGATRKMEMENMNA